MECRTLCQEDYTNPTHNLTEPSRNSLWAYLQILDIGEMTKPSTLKKARVEEYGI